MKIQFYYGKLMLQEVHIYLVVTYTFWYTPACYWLRNIGLKKYGSNIGKYSVL